MTNWFDRAKDPREPARRAAATPRLCIGVPVYNGERFLAETLDCLLGQTFRDLEVVVSDNASTDATESICREYARRDERLVYVRQERNGGGIWNFNRLVGYCRSPYFSWHAHDDLRTPDCYERCLAHLEDDRSLAWCHSRTGAIDAEGRPVTTSRHHGAWDPEPELLEQAAGRPCRFGRLADDPVGRFRGVLMGRSYCLDVFGVIRAEVLRTTRGIPEHIHSGKELLLELAARGGYHEIPEELFFWRLHDAQASSHASAAQDAQWNGRRRVSFDPSNYFARLRGYAAAAAAAPLGLRGRLGCLASLVPYLLQVGKYAHVARVFLGANRT